MFRRIPGEAFSGIEKEGALPDVDPRTPATAGEKATEGSGLGEGNRVCEAGEAGREALRLCNLVAQSPSDAERGKRTSRRRSRGREGLTGRETDPWEIIYFKLYQSQMPVIEKAIETEDLMLGSDPIPKLQSGDDLC